MHKTTLLSLLAAGAFILSACGASTSSASGSTSFRNSSALRSRPLSPEAKLALGTIKLEGSPQAVDAAEAAKLLPLWQLMAQLNGSSSTAPQEVTAVMDQIQATMDPAQVKSISSMQLTAADVFSSFQQGQSGSGFSADPGGTSGARSASNAAGQRGGGGFVFGGGGFPGGGGFGGANRAGAAANGSSAAASAAQAAQQFSNQISTAVVNQLVQLLQARLKN